MHELCIFMYAVRSIPRALWHRPSAFSVCVRVFVNELHSVFDSDAGGCRIIGRHVGIDSVERRVFENIIAAAACRFGSKAHSMIFFVDMTADFRANPPADALHCYSAIADKSIVFVVLSFEQNRSQTEPEIFIAFKVPLNPKVNTVAVIRLFTVFHRFGIRKNFVQCIKIRMSVFAENEPLCLKFNNCLQNLFY